MIMEDPIISEVRKAGEEIARRANYDIPTFSKIVKEDVKRIEKEYGIKWKRAIRKNGKFVIVEG